MAIYVNDHLVTFGAYPNGEAVVPKHYPSFDPIRVPKVRLHWENDADILQLALVRGHIGQLKRVPQNPDLVIDYMPYSRMDHADQNEYCFSLAYVASLIDSMKWGSITLVEPHSVVALEQFTRARAVYPSVKLLPTVMAWTDFVQGRDILVLPDAGAATRYRALAPELFETNHMMVLKKSRNFATGQIEGLVIDHTIVRGGSLSHDAKNAIIVDDLSSRGGTFVQAAGLLTAYVKSLQHVSLLVTHMEPAGLLGALRHNIDRVFFTDTMTQPRPLPSNFHSFDRSYWL